MSASETRRSSTRASQSGQLLLVAAFAIGLLFPAVGMMMGQGGLVVSIELRFPEPLPGIPTTRDEVESFPKQMDTYLNDHFGYRSKLLSLNSRLFVAIGASPSPKYLIGKDGWFFHRTADGVLDQYRGIDRFSPDELEHWVKTMEQTQQGLARRGIRLLIAVAPSKHSIYPEFLPDWANVVHPTGRYQQILNRVAEGSPLEIVDLHGPLRKAKKQHTLYYKHDAHWNQLGAHAAYVAIVERIRESHPNVPLRNLDWYDIEWIDGEAGSMIQRLNIADKTATGRPVLRPKSGSFVIRTDWPDGKPTGLMEMMHLTQVIESDLPNTPVVTFVRDSFATLIAEFTQESFKRTVLVHHGYGGFRRGLVLRQRPDIVVYEMTERGLSWRLRPGR